MLGFDRLAFIVTYTLYWHLLTIPSTPIYHHHMTWLTAAFACCNHHAALIWSFISVLKGVSLRERLTPCLCGQFATCSVNTPCSAMCFQQFSQFVWPMRWHQFGDRLKMVESCCSVGGFWLIGISACSLLLLIYPFSSAFGFFCHFKIPTFEPQLRS